MTEPSRTGGLRRFGCAAALFIAAIGVPYLAVTGLWIVGGGNHRTVERRTVSPDGRYEVRVQNDVRGSIQPILWTVYIKLVGTRSDDPESSCALAEVQGEDGWRTVEPIWRGAALELHSRPEAATLALRKPLASRAPGCAPVVVRIVAR